METTYNIIVKADSYEVAYLRTIKQTIQIFEECITEFPNTKPTCNQEQYVKDVRFLLGLLNKIAK